MLGFIKRLFGKKEQKESLAESAEKVVVQKAASASAVSIQQVKSVNEEVTAPSLDIQDKNNLDIQDRNNIFIPLQSIIAGLPDYLKKEVVKNPDAEVIVRFSTGRILPQLPSGVVKVTFRELKNASLPGFFSSNTARDNEIIYLPLDRIIPQALPLLKRKPAKETVSVSSEIPDIFGAKGRIIAEEKQPATEVMGETVVEEEKPVAPQQRPVLSQPESLAAAIRMPEPKMPEPAVAPIKMSVTEEKNAEKIQITKDRGQGQITAPEVDVENSIVVEIASLAAAWNENIKKRLDEAGVLKSKVYIPVSELEPQMRRGKVEFTWEKLNKWIAPEPVAGIIEQETILELPLSVLAPLFLARFKKPQVQKKVTVSEELPDLFGKQGVVNEVKLEEPETAVTPKPVPEKQVTEVPKPAEQPEKEETPSKVKTPLTIKFGQIPLKFKTETQPHQGVVFPEPIEKTVKPEPAVVKQDKPAPSVEKPGVPKPKSLGELFNVPDKPVWSPNEIVRHMLSFPGVSGVMIVLKDGLPVVAKLPQTIKPEALAGFIPEMFTKLDNYIQDLKFGAINHICVACDDFKLYACRSGNIFLVVVGEKDTPTLSLDTIQFIADEFSKPLKK